MRYDIYIYIYVIRRLKVKTVWLQLGCAKECHGFREMKTRIGGRVLLVVLNLYVRIKIRVATFDTNHSVTDSPQSIVASIQKFPDSVVKSVSTARHRQSMCQAKRSGYRSV